MAVREMIINPLQKQGEVDYGIHWLVRPFSSLLITHQRGDRLVCEGIIFFILNMPLSYCLLNRIFEGIHTSILSRTIIM